jgi:hypothetical protein
MKRHLRSLAMLLALACSAVVHAGSNEDIFAAVESGSAPEVKRLLAAGTDVNGRDERGATPLLLAALSGSTEIDLATYLWTPVLIKRPFELQSPRVTGS